MFLSNEVIVLIDSAYDDYSLDQMIDILIVGVIA